MAKRFYNDTLFGVHGVNPNFNARDEQNSAPASKNTGKVILKRQQLLACPYLQVDEPIKLLNLQKNCIVKIANLDHLTSLVVLDLCENEIDAIQGLDNLSSLRILRLANNKIRQIKNLDALKQLDVLDLNGNQISRLENLKQMTFLRVLNLAYNRIEKCENLQYLRNLVELNLQGNLIVTAVDLDALPIQRLNLSSNKIRRFDDIRCVSKLMALEWLSLEGNPLPFSAAYEQIILTQSQSATTKSDPRQLVTRDQRINRALKMQNSSGENNSTQRDRRVHDTSIQHQDSFSERSDADFDGSHQIQKSNSTNAASAPVQNRTGPVQQAKTPNKILSEPSNPLFSEPKVNPLVHERTMLAKSLVQSAMDDAFQKELVAVQLERFWPIFLKHSITD